MEFVEQLFRIGEDLGFFLVYGSAYWISVLYDRIISWIPRIFWAFTHIITVFRGLFFNPIQIIIKVLFQLFLLPVNIPLRVLLGVSVKQILLNSANWTDSHVILTILQYWFAVGILGISIGAICGASFSFVHSIWMIPDIYIEIPIKFWKHIPYLGKLLGNISSLYRDIEANLNGIKTAPSPLLTRLSETPQSPILADSTTSSIPTTPKYKPKSKQSSKPSSVSRENILKVASRLPSDFFRQVPSEGKSDRESQLYISPSQFSQDSTSNSSTEFTNLWDRVEESPTTLKTEDGLAALPPRRNFLGNDKIGNFAVK